MTYSVQFSDADAAILSQCAAENRISVSDFMREAVMKVARNARYIAMLDESDRQLHEGRVIVKTMDELENMAAE